MAAAGDIWSWVETFLPWVDPAITLRGMLLDWLLFTLLPGIPLWAAARLISRRHARALSRREAYEGRPRIDTRHTVPDGYADPVFIAASVVTSHAAVRSLPVLVRRLLGGRIGVYERMLDRARREALLRLEVEAQARGADLIAGVRLGAQPIGTGIEVIAYGTALVAEGSAITEGRHVPLGFR